MFHDGDVFDQTYSLDEAAARLGISRSKVFNMVADGRLPFVEIHDNADTGERKHHRGAAKRGRKCGQLRIPHDAPGLNAPRPVVVAGLRFPAWVGPELERRRARLARGRG